jgi:hypothetical protein
LKSFLISASLVAVGVIYFHRVIEDRSHLIQPDERQRGEIVIANAPDGTLRGRWPNPTPAPGSSK